MTTQLELIHKFYQQRAEQAESAVEREAKRRREAEKRLEMALVELKKQSALISQQDALISHLKGAPKQQQHSHSKNKSQQFVPKLDLSKVRVDTADGEEEDSKIVGGGKVPPLDLSKLNGGQMKLDLAFKGENKKKDYQDEFMDMVDEFSESWRADLDKEKRF